MPDVLEMFRRALASAGVSLPTDPEAAMRGLTDDQLRQLLLTSAMALKMVKEECVRRGKWDEWKGEKVRPTPGV